MAFGSWRKPVWKYNGRGWYLSSIDSYYKNYRHRSARRKANREASAARQQRDSCTVVINRIASVGVEIPVGNGSASAVISHWNELRQSSFFPNYAPMYDQMKIEKIRVKFTGSRAGSAQTSNISPAVVIAFDRNGLSASQQVTTTTISTYSSAQLKQWSTGNAFVMYQTIYPSTIMEKGQYLPTESLVNPADDTGSENPCTYLSDPQLPFKPVTMIGVDLGGNVDAVNTFAFTAEYEYTVTFRGMRKPSLSSSGGDVSLIPLNESIVSNGTFSYAPTGDEDGFSEVSIVVNVPQSVTVGYLANTFRFTYNNLNYSDYTISSLTAGTTQSISGDFNTRQNGSYIYYDSSDRGIHWTSTGSNYTVSITFTSSQYFIFGRAYNSSSILPYAITIYDRNGVLVSNLGNLAVGGTVYVPDNIVVDLN